MSRFSISCLYNRPKLGLFRIIKRYAEDYFRLLRNSGLEYPGRTGFICMEKYSVLSYKFIIFA